MTNGVFEIKLGKETIKLLLGFNASSEFETRYYRHLVSGIAPSEGILFTDLVFSGLYCNAIRNGETIPAYGDVYELVEKLGEQDDFNEIRTKLWAVYYESKWGMDFEKRVKEFADKKKVAENQPGQ